MLRRVNLRKILRLRCIGLVAAGAQDRGIELVRLNQCGIVGMLRLRPVTGFAVHPRMLAALLLIENIPMASFTILVPRKPRGTRGHFRHRLGSVMSELAKALGNKESSDYKEYQKTSNEDRR